MRKLFPDPAATVDVVEAYGRLEPPSPGQAVVRANMVASVDGAATWEGRSGSLGGPADRMVFFTLRSLADVILVGAGTVRAERYGPARLDEAARARRLAWGLPPVPPIAVLTGSGRLDWDAPFFTKAEQRPLIITASTVDPTMRTRAEEVADVIIAGEDHVDLGRALAALADRGWQQVLCEGGPKVIAQLVGGGLLDELCLTVSPTILGGHADRILSGPPIEPAAALDLRLVLEADGFLFLRYGLH